MERAIGDLGGEIHQPSNPFANLSQRGLVRCQVNALKAMIPELERTKSNIPRGAIDLGGSYILLRAKERTARMISSLAGAAIARFFEENTGRTFLQDLKIVRWSRLALPNGQIARSKWKEDFLNPLRMSRNVKV